MGLLLPDPIAQPVVWTDERTKGGAFAVVSGECAAVVNGRWTVGRGGEKVARAKPTGAVLTRRRIDPPVRVDSVPICSVSSPSSAVLCC